MKEAILGTLLFLKATKRMRTSVMALQGEIFGDAIGRWEITVTLASLQKGKCGTRLLSKMQSSSKTHDTCIRVSSHS